MAAANASARGQRTAILASPLRELTGFCLAVNCLTPDCRGERVYRDEARGRIRTLLAMESHVVEGVDISEADIDRIEKAIRDGKLRAEVFPRCGFRRW